MFIHSSNHEDFENCHYPKPFERLRIISEKQELHLNLQDNGVEAAKTVIYCVTKKI